MPVKRLGGGGDMPEHDELINELPLVEKMSTAERLKHAKKRRIHQLKKFSQYEKQLDKEQNKKNKKSHQNKKIKRSDLNRRVQFVNNVMLLEAAARNDIEEVKYLLTHNVDPDVTNEDGLTALHQCCIDDLEEMLRLLLQHGASVNAQDSEMWTPLHAAATCGHIHLCRILIDNGAELLAVNADGNMPYDICEDEVTLDFIENEMAKRGVTQDQIDDTRLSTEVTMLKDLQSLSKDKGDLEFRGRVMETPLHIAAANGYIQVTEFLIKHNVSINVEDDDSWQPIHAAACWGHLPVLEILVQHGADLDAKTKNGETPYDICEDIEMRERLMELKSEIAAKGPMKSRNLVRRRSTNTRSPKNSPRNPVHSSVVSNSSGSIYSSNTSLAEKNHLSASVRRVSSKEKGAISFKEAVEEGRRLRESVSDNEDDEDGEINRQNIQNGIKQESETRPEDVQVFMPVLDPSPKSSPRQESLKEEQIPPPAAFSEPDPSPPQSKKSEKSTKVSHIVESIAQQNPPQIVVDSKESPKAKPQPQQQRKPEPKKAPAPPLVTSTDSIDSNKAGGKKTQKKTAPKPPEERKPESNKSLEVPLSVPAAAAENGNKVEHIQLPSRDIVDHSTPHDGFVTPDRSKGTAAHHLPQGTLSDLKKQRALKLQERLQDSLRFKDGDRAQTEITNYNNENHSPENPVSKPTANSNSTSTNPSSQQYTNGQNGKVQNQPPNNNSYYVQGGSGDTIKKYKFSDTTSVVGDTDTQTSCCVVQ